MNEKEVVLAYWQEMETNDFRKASKFLAESFECHWPQSSEIIIGRENFVAINEKYPSNGKWKFQIQSIVHEGCNVVSDVKVTDGQVKARAITFHTIDNGLISKQVEFWPDDYPAPSWREQWVS